jgi:GMP synthase-like glutamine amidotransferase
MKIGILQTGKLPAELKDSHQEYAGMFEKLLAGKGFLFESFLVVDDVFPNSVEAADGWLITGSKHAAYEDLAWIRRLEGFIREIYAAGKPLVGICFGHQVIATALGGVVEKFDGGWSVGRVEYQMHGFDSPVPVLAWHQDQVTRLPADAKVIGHTDFCANAMLIYGDKILSVQPHPEFSGSFMQGLIRTRGRGLVPDDQLAEASATLEQPLATQKIADMFADFFRQPR